jgi:hypothetical protein
LTLRVARAGDFLAADLYGDSDFFLEIDFLTGVTDFLTGVSDFLASRGAEGRGEALFLAETDTRGVLEGVFFIFKFEINLLLNLLSLIKPVRKQ